jgi:hypothetical protein
MFKKLMAAALLLFAGVAVVTVVVRGAGEHASPSAAQAGNHLSQNLQEGLAVYYFHGATRCPTCEKIEAYAHEAIETGFPDDLEADRVQWRIANYESPENRKLVSDYKVFTSSVVLVRYANGKPVEWKNLEQVWDLVHDKGQFLGFIQQQAAELLNSENTLLDGSTRRADLRLDSRQHGATDD